MLKLQIELNKQIAKSIVDSIQYAKLEGKKTAGDGIAQPSTCRVVCRLCGTSGEHRRRSRSNSKHNESIYWWNSVIPFGRVVVRIDFRYAYASVWCVLLAFISIDLERWMCHGKWFFSFAQSPLRMMNRYKLTALLQSDAKWIRVENVRVFIVVTHQSIDTNFKINSQFEITCQRSVQYQSVWPRFFFYRNCVHICVLYNSILEHNCYLSLDAGALFPPRFSINNHKFAIVVSPFVSQSCFSFPYGKWIRQYFMRLFRWLNFVHSRVFHHVNWHFSFLWFKYIICWNAAARNAFKTLFAELILKRHNVWAQWNLFLDSQVWDATMRVIRTVFESDWK